MIDAMEAHADELREEIARLTDELTRTEAALAAYRGEPKQPRRYSRVNGAAPKAKRGRPKGTTANGTISDQMLGHITKDGPMDVKVLRQRMGSLPSGSFYNPLRRLQDQGKVTRDGDTVALAPTREEVAA